jgi:hypothetical protein
MRLRLFLIDAVWWGVWDAHVLVSMQWFMVSGITEAFAA